MRFTQKRICTTRFIRNTDGNRHLAAASAKARQSAVVVPATISKPIPISIKPHARHEQKIRHDDLTGSRLMNPMLADLHRHIRRPDMKFERFTATRDNRQSSAPQNIAR